LIANVDELVADDAVAIDYVGQRKAVRRTEPVGDLGPRKTT
jgi:hypothetical protein